MYEGSIEHILINHDVSLAMMFLLTFENFVFVDRVILTECYKLKLKHTILDRQT